MSRPTIDDHRIPDPPVLRAGCSARILDIPERPLHRLTGDRAAGSAGAAGLRPDTSGREVFRARVRAGHAHTGHAHTGHEIRFVAAGAGSFAPHVAARVVDAPCASRDPIAVPAAIAQRPDAGRASRVTALRVSAEATGRVPHDVGDAIGERCPVV